MKVKCPGCGKLLEIPDKLLGKIVKCPCGRQLRVHSNVANSAGASSGRSLARPEKHENKKLSSEPPACLPAKIPPPVPSRVDDHVELGDLTPKNWGGQVAAVVPTNVNSSFGARSNANKKTQSIHLNALSNAESEIREMKLTDALEQSRKQFIIALSSVFFAIVIPLSIYLVVKFGVGTTTFYQEWGDKIAEDSLRIRAQNSRGVIGPESQAMFELNRNSEYRKPEMLEELASRYEARVNAILAPINEKLASGGKLKQSILDSIKGYPKELTVKSIKCDATEYDRIKIELIVHGEPLNHDFVATYYATDIDQPSWIGSDDNWDQGSTDNTALRKQIRDELISKMQFLKSNLANNQGESRSGSSNKTSTSYSESQGQSHPESPRSSSAQVAKTWKPKVLNVTIGAGDVAITDRGDDGLSNVKIVCNNGLIIDADWKRNVFNDFGYDIYEPTVSMDYNRLAVMTMARGVIANYLNGEYD